MVSSRCVKVFTGRSCVNFTKSLVEYLGVQLGNIEVGNFSDGEIRVELKESVRNCVCFIVQSTCPPVNENLLELLIVADTLKRAGACKIIAAIPYFGYARQDRGSRDYEPITAKLVADLLVTSGISEIVTVDLHVPQISGFFNIPVTVLNGQEILAGFVKKSVVQERDDFVIVAPDLGSLKRARNFSSLLGDFPVVVVNKVRDRVNECRVTEQFGSVKGKNAILVDDIIDTAGTICAAVDKLISHGSSEIYVCASHGLFSGAACEKINNRNIKGLFLLDTVPLKCAALKTKVKVVPFYEKFGEAMKRLVS